MRASAGGAVGQREAGQDSCKVQSGNKERMLFNATSACRKIYRAGNAPDTSTKKSY